MIILDFFLLCFLILLLYLKEEKIENVVQYPKETVNKKKDKKKKIEIIENLEIIKNNNNKLPEIINDYNIEVDRPIFSCSNYKNDKIIDFNNLNEELINITYDKLVDDNKNQNVDYDNMSFYNSNDNYYDIKNDDNYGYTNFMTYKK
jgi:hypothetical protein